MSSPDGSWRLSIQKSTDNLFAEAEAEAQVFRLQIDVSGGPNCCKIVGSSSA